MKEKILIRAATVAEYIAGGLTVREVANALTCSIGTVSKDLTICVSRGWLEKTFPEITHIKTEIGRRGKSKVTTSKMNMKKAIYGKGPAYNEVLEIMNISRGKGAGFGSFLPLIEPLRVHRIQYDIDISDFGGRRNKSPVTWLKGLASYWEADYKESQNTFYFWRRERIRDIRGEMAFCEILFVYSDKRRWFRVFLPDIPYNAGEEQGQNLLNDWIGREINNIMRKIVNDLGIKIVYPARPVSSIEYALPLRFFEIFNFKGNIVIDMPTGYKITIDKSKGWPEADIKNRLEADNAADLLFKQPARNQAAIMDLQKNLGNITELLKQLIDMQGKSIEAQADISNNILALVHSIEGSKSVRETDLSRETGGGGYA